MNPEIYRIVEREQLREMLETFESCVKLPIEVIDSNGKLLEHQGNSTHFCNIFKKHLPSYDQCEIVHSNAGRQAARLGETYIFSCHANLNHIVFPLIHKSTYLGSILVGPFLMDTPDTLLLLDINKRYSIPTESLLELYEEINSVPFIKPTNATQISRLLYYMFAGLISDSKNQYILNQNKLHQQAKIGESIQMYKGSPSPSNSNYPYEKEKVLITKVKTGNVKDAKGILNDLLGYVLFSEGNSLEIVKSRAIELISLLSRAAIEGGAATDTILKINNEFLKSIESVSSMESLCYKLQESVEVFTESMFNMLPVHNQELVRRAMHYISQHYMNKLSLEEVASYVHLTPSYFSTVFKQACGSSFRKYLNMIRIEESKRLLANTDYPIIDIAIATGFADQSYFSKVFKRFTGLTPKQFR